MREILSNFIILKFTFVHEGAVYYCNQCEYKTTQKDCLQQHIASVHERIVYSCNQCEYKATQKDFFQ